MITMDFLESKAYDLYNTLERIKGASTEEALPILKAKVKDLTTAGVIESAKMEGWANFQTHRFYQQVSQDKDVLNKAKSLIQEAKDNPEINDELIDVSATNQLMTWLRERTQDHIEATNLEKTLQVILLKTLMELDWPNVCKQIVLSLM